MSRIVLIFAILLSFPSPLLADWYYLKWGMTKQQAIAASKGEARATESGYEVSCLFVGQKPFAFIPKKAIGEFFFKATFCTSEKGDKLTSVALSGFDKTNVYAVKRALVSQYGKPTETSGMSIWNDAKNGNTITYAPLSDIVARIEYKKYGRTGF